jgi:hypothetical protein
MTYQKYPLVMKHPNHSPAEYRQQPGNGKGLFAPDTVMTKAERFPDVTVYTLAQEKEYAARGYRPANMGDEREYEKAILESVPDDGYKYHEYPKWKYHPINLPLIVHSKEEEDSLGDGWSDRPVEATEDDLDEEEEVKTTPAPAPTPKRGGNGRGARA